MRWGGRREQSGERDGAAVGVGEGEVRRLLADSGGLTGRGKVLPKIKNDKAEEGQGRHAERGEDRAGNFSAIESGGSEGPAQANEKKNEGESEKQKIDPGHVAGDRVPGEERGITYEREEA